MNNSGKKDDSSLKNFLKSPVIYTDNKAIQYSGLGIQLVVVILVFLFIGVWLDKVFKTEFVFTLILTFLGFGGGFYSFYLSIKELTKSEKKVLRKPDEKE